MEKSNSGQYSYGWLPAVTEIAIFKIYESVAGLVTERTVFFECRDDVASHFKRHPGILFVPDI